MEKIKTIFAALSCILTHLNFCTTLNMHFGAGQFCPKKLNMHFGACQFCAKKLNMHFDPCQFCTKLNVLYFGACQFDYSAKYAFWRMPI